MRPKLRDDCTYLAVEDGVYLEAATGSARLTGRAAFGLVDRLAPHLTGERTLDALTAGLPGPHRRAVTDLVAELLRRGLARDVDTDPPHGLTTAELDRYADEIAFAEHVGNAPVSRFEAFRTSRVLLVGAGHAMAALVQSLLSLGLRAPTVAVTGEPAGDPDDLRRVLHRCRDRDPGLELNHLTEPDRLWHGAPAGRMLAGYDAVLHCTDRPMHVRARALTRAGRAAGVPVLHALPLAGDGWIGPVGAGACWECAWWNLRGAMIPGDPAWRESAADDPDRPVPDLSGPLAAVLGTKLGFAYFRRAIGVPEPAARITRLDLRSAMTTEHTVVAHHRCPDCGGGDDADAPPSGPEEFSRAAAALVDDRLGPLLRLGTGNHAQLPLNVVDAVLPDVTGTGRGTRVVTAVGASRAEALRRAAVVALESIAVAVDAEPGLRPAAVAGGFSWAEAQGRALLRLRSGRARPPRGGPGDAGWPTGTWPEPARRLADRAAVLGTELYAWSDRSSIPTVFVGGAGTWLAHCCSVDTDSALTAATQAALAALTGRTAPGCDVGVEPGVVSGWPDLLPQLLAGPGEPVLLRRCDGGPALRSVLPYVAAVVPGGPA
ncbi:TOMM precursor leader peptide-binding protein [Jidongwangia harbinensis]|uniref:TOMM precursor leader peptide-binding protein n=1 Tax=Jidongwangia harbinensis TaxID=2878561 RepID=UPI001CD976A7|nr:TOMM precursor leader peptide-binding protein [Jidongwangia harbinensis]MCA2216670.1 TOMM precursor leader peptide-binding protein [Jidongwangia harbinensis]